jgi:hypothetical protein
VKRLGNVVTDANDRLLINFYFLFIKNKIFK